MKDFDVADKLLTLLEQNDPPNPHIEEGRAIDETDTVIRAVVVYEKPGGVSSRYVVFSLCGDPDDGRVLEYGDEESRWTYDDGHRYDDEQIAWVYDLLKEVK